METLEVLKDTLEELQGSLTTIIRQTMGHITQQNAGTGQVTSVTLFEVNSWNEDYELILIFGLQSV